MSALARRGTSVIVFASVIALMVGCGGADDVIKNFDNVRPPQRVPGGAVDDVVPSGSFDDLTPPGGEVAAADDAAYTKLHEALETGEDTSTAACWALQFANSGEPEVSARWQLRSLVPAERAGELWNAAVGTEENARIELLNAYCDVAG